MAGRHRRVRSGAPPRHRKPPRRGHVAVPSLAAAAILGIGGVGASAALSSGGGHSAARPTLPRPVVTASSQPPAPAASRPATPPAPAARPLPDFAIRVTGRACWVEVTGPRGHVLIAAIVRHGRTVSFGARPLAVTLGDAGAVRLVLHHHAQAHAPGRPGQVLRFTVR